MKPLVYSVSSERRNRGLILIQIDGLSRKQLSEAIKNGKMPFVKSLIRKNGYKTGSFYSGLPSSTPSVQAELMYGVRCVVPSFGFFDRKKGVFVSMLYSQIVNEITEKLQKKNEGLLKGGSAYADEFTGDAKKALFCVGRNGFDWKWIKNHPLEIFLVIIIHIGIILRISLLLVVELILAITNLLNGLINNENFVMEVSFIPARIGICVLLRELIVAGVGRDIFNGYPIIHCNFNGYDEQAHRRGPSSDFAHWTLKGIDNAISRIAKKTKICDSKKYDLWIYSDHGQENSIPYQIENKKRVQDAITEVFKCKVVKGYDQPVDTTIQIRKCISGIIEIFEKKFKINGKRKKVFISSMGPVGHIYIFDKLTMNQKWYYASALVKNAKIPSVLFKSDSNRVFGYTNKGACSLPENIGDITGADHPFVKDISEDLITLVKHHYSGEFVILGWRADKAPVSFSIEDGAHGGPGYEETHGFVLSDSDHPVFYQKYLRPMDLRRAALDHITLQENENLNRSKRENLLRFFKT